MTPTIPLSAEVRAADLKPALVGLGKLVPRSPSLAILGCVRVEAVGPQTLRLTTTDLDLSLSLDLPVAIEIGSGKGERKGFAPFLLPLSRLRELVVGSRPDEVVSLTPSIKAPPVDEFPEIPLVRTPGLTLPEPAVTSLLRAFDCASHDSTRAVLRSACLDTSGTGEKAHRIVGTDGRHLFSSNSMQLPLKRSVILPDHPLWSWKPLADSRPWTLRLGKDKHQVETFRLEGVAWSVTGRLLDGPYPNYRQVIPPEGQFTTRVRLDDAALAAVVRLLPRLPGKQLSNRPIGLHFEKGRFGLLARSENDEPWILHPVDRCEMEGPNLTVFVNRDYLIKAGAFGLSQVSLGDAMSPVKFSRGGDLMIVMPVRAIDPDKMERPALPPAVELFAPTPVVPKPLPVKVEPTPPAPTPPLPPKRVPSMDPLTEARQQVAEANEALLTAKRTLKGINRTLHSARTERSELKSELRGFRGLLHKLRKGKAKAA